jgi:hypothetical protein
MRVFVLLPILLVACASTPPAEPVSMRDLLADETHLFVIARNSAGAITAQLRTATGWEDGVVELQLAGGELITRAAPGGALALTSVQLELQTIAIPATLTGHEVVLALQLSWSLTVDGVGVQVGAPRLPPLPVKLELTGGAARVTADLRIQAAGELWSWANLVKLSDLELVLGAGTASR